MKTRAIPALITALFALSLASCVIDRDESLSSESLSSASCYSSLKSTEEAKGNIAFVLNEDGQSYSVTGDINYLVTGEIIVPSTYNGLPVTRVKERGFALSRITSIRLPDTIEIGEYAFANSYYLREVYFGNGLRTIGNQAFQHCQGIEKITIPDSTLTIGDYAFVECFSAKFLGIGRNLKHIGDSVFRGCTGLSNALLLPEGLTHIGEFAFHSTSISMAYIPKSVTYIGEGAFNKNDLFEYIGVDPENENYSSIDGVLYDKNQDEVLCFPTAKSPVTIPDTIPYIGDSAYSNCKYFGENLVIPESIIRIGSTAFLGIDNLKTVTLGSNVAVMGQGAFAGCLNLVEVNLNEALTFISPYCFECTDIASLSLPNSITSIGQRAFQSCQLLESLTINRGLTSIGDDVFQHCDNLSALNYEGTMEEWSQIELSENWLRESIIETIHCSDGDVGIVRQGSAD